MIAAAEEAPPDERVRTGLAAAIALAETDPVAARAALRELRGDHVTLRRLETLVSGSEEEATLALGAAIQVALSELDSPAPDLRGRFPELARWLERDW